MRRIFVGFAGLLITAAAIAAIRYEYARTHEEVANRQIVAAVPVETAIAAARDVPIILRGLGQVVAYNTVNIQSRVEGNITAVDFHEGQMVRAGDQLFQIDPRPYQAALDEARALLARDQALLANARVDLQRYAELLKEKSGVEQQWATQKALVAQDVATVENDKAAIEAAALNVEYASIKSPVDGITGILQVDFGNLVQVNTSSGSSTLVTVTQIEPIYVVFTLPEADIQRVRKAMRGGQLRVEAFDQADEKAISSGVLNLIDNTVNQTTGTVQLKAQFPNNDTALWPGQFVNAHLELKFVHDGVTIPAAAVQTGPNGSYAYVVQPNSTVEMRPITVTQTENNISLIGSGLHVGEEVVTAGQFELRPGAKVRASNAPAQEAPPTSPMTSAQSAPK